MESETERRDTTLINEIVTRLSIIEVYIKAREEQERDDRRWLRGLVLAFIVQVVLLIGGGATAAVKLGGLIQELEAIDIADLHRDNMIALKVLADHGTEFAQVRGEQFRLRERLDGINEEMRDRTQDRFYKSDAVRLEERIRRLEIDHRNFQSNRANQND